MTKPKANPRKGGRPKGSLNRITEAQKRKALARGLSPLEVMTDLMNWHYRRWKQAVGKNAPDADQASKADAVIAAATELAPYMHPKHAAIQHSGNGGGPIQIIFSNSDADL